MVPTLRKAFFKRTQISLTTNEKTDKLNNINSRIFNYRVKSQATVRKKIFTINNNGKEPFKDILKIK